MPTTPPEDDLHAHAPIVDGAELAQPDFGMNPPEHISMNDLGYLSHVLSNAMSAIKGCINYPDDPVARQDLENSKQKTIGSINFLLKRYGEDLRDMPDLSKPGRHLSQHDTEAVESEPSLRLTVADHCKNPEGLHVGLSAVQRDRLGVEKGETVELFDDKNKSLGVFTVGAGSSEYVDHTDLFTANGIPESALVTVRKSITDPSKPKELSFPAIHSVETIDAGKHAERKGKIAQRFPDLDAQAYIVLPTPVASELLGIKPEKSKTTGKLILPISRGRVKVDGKETDIAIVPSGQTVGFTSAAAQKLNIPSELSEIKIIIDKGVLIIA